MLASDMGNKIKKDTKETKKERDIGTNMILNYNKKIIEGSIMHEEDINIGQYNENVLARNFIFKNANGFI